MESSFLAISCVPVPPDESSTVSMLPTDLYQPHQRRFPDEAFQWKILEQDPEWVGGLGLKAILKRLRTLFRCKLFSPEEVVWQRFETADGRLHRAGYLLLLEHPSLVLVPFHRFPFQPEAAAVVSSQQKGFAADGLPGGYLKARLEHICGRRKALPIALLQGRFTPINLRDAEDKLVLRLCLAEVYNRNSDGVENSEGAAIWAEPVRGYEKELSRAIGLLASPACGGKLPASGWFRAVPDTGYEAGSPLFLGPDLLAGPEASLPGVLASQFAQARLNERGIIEDVDAVFLDEYQSAIESVESALRVFEEHYTAKTARKIGEHLGSFGERARALQGFSLFASQKAHLIERVPPTLEVGVHGVFELMRRGKKERQVSFARYLSDKDYAKRSRETASLLEKGRSDPGPPRAEVLSSVFLKRLKTLDHPAPVAVAQGDGDVLERIQNMVTDLVLLLRFLPQKPFGEAKKFKQWLDEIGALIAELRACLFFQGALLERIDEAENTTVDIDLAVGAMITILYQDERTLRTRIEGVYERMDTNSLVLSARKMGKAS